MGIACGVKAADRFQQGGIRQGQAGGERGVRAADHGAVGTHQNHLALLFRVDLAAGFLGKALLVHHQQQVAQALAGEIGLVDGPHHDHVGLAARGQRGDQLEGVSVLGAGHQLAQGGVLQAVVPHAVDHAAPGVQQGDVFGQGRNEQVLLDLAGDLQRQLVFGVGVQRGLGEHGEQAQRVRAELLPQLGGIARPVQRPEDQDGGGAHHRVQDDEPPEDAPLAQGQDDPVQPGTAPRSLHTELPPFRFFLYHTTF